MYSRVRVTAMIHGTQKMTKAMVKYYPLKSTSKVENTLFQNRLAQSKYIYFVDVMVVATLDVCVWNIRGTPCNDVTVIGSKRHIYIVTGPKHWVLSLSFNQTPI